MDPVAALLTRAGECPEAPAVVIGDATVGYGAFAERVARLASAIAAAGEAPRVLIDLPQGADAYTAMFAALMAGGTYCPVNREAPAVGQERAFRAFAPAVVVSDAATGRRPWMAGVAMVDAADRGAEPLAVPRDPAEAAYVMFTSGSTGVPKGVVVPSAGLAHYCDWAARAFVAGAGDRWSQFPNIAFDLSVLDIYGALTSGAALHPPSGPTDRLMPGALARRERLTIWNSVPTAIDLLAQAGQATAETLASVRMASFCGEPLRARHLGALFDARADIRVRNTYGPTEATVSCTEIELDAEGWEGVCRPVASLGAAIPGMELHLINGHDADHGEIAISGPQLALGYLNDPVRTERSFPELTLADGRRRRVYRTGDLARREGGLLYFEGRADRQVKITGHRIELGEIDAAVERVCAAPAASVVANDRLVIFLAAATAPDAAALRAKLRGELPAYALPVEIRAVGRFPRTANDKIDFAALTEMAGRAHAAG